MADKNDRVPNEKDAVRKSEERAETETRTNAEAEKATFNPSPTGDRSIPNNPSSSFRQSSGVEKTGDGSFEIREGAPSTVREGTTGSERQGLINDVPSASDTPAPAIAETGIVGGPAVTTPAEDAAARSVEKVDSTVQFVDPEIEERDPDTNLPVERDPLDPVPY